MMPSGACRRPLLAANWKMHKTSAEARAFVAEFLPLLKRDDADVVLCPPFTALQAVADALRATPAIRRVISSLPM